MKNIINLMLCILIFTTACNKNSNISSDNQSFQIGIAVINSHPALLEIERGIKDELKAQNINAFIIQNVLIKYAKYMVMDMGLT